MNELIYEEPGMNWYEKLRHIFSVYCLGNEAHKEGYIDKTTIKDHITEEEVKDDRLQEKIKEQPEMVKESI